MQLEVDRRLLGRAVFGLVAVLLAAAVLGVVLREPIAAVAEVFIGRFGLFGVFVGVLITDSSPLPMTHEPILLLAVAREVDPVVVGVVAAAASVTAGPVGYLGGLVLRRGAGARTWLEHRGPGMVEFLERWGATGVAIAALLPIPFALATWTSGIVGVPFLKVAAASLLRIPKTWFYLSLIVGGWAVGG